LEKDWGQYLAGGLSYGEGAQVVGIQQPCGTRNAQSQSGAECHLPP